MFLGFDISTAIVGISCVDKNGDILFCKHCDLRKEKGLFAKVDCLKKYLADIRYLQSIVREVWIEEPFTFFRRGGSSDKTMALLQRFNGMASLAIRDAFHLEPQYVIATQARKINNIKVPRGTKAKEEVLKFLVDNVPSFSVEYTRHGNPKPGYYDRADSVIIARAGQTLWKQKNSES